MHSTLCALLALAALGAADQITILNDLYAATKGEYWDDNSGWGVGNECSGWKGVICDNRGVVYAQLCATRWRA
jgi:hypothetical protein